MEEDKVSKMQEHCAFFAGWNSAMRKVSKAIPIPLSLIQDAEEAWQEYWAVTQVKTKDEGNYGK
jgi:hypothetical protein